MKRSFLILLTPLVLAGCVKQSASHYIEGNQHSVSLRAEQEYFWNDEVIVKMVAARLPECQRQFSLTTLPIGNFDVELFSGGDNVYTLRAGPQLWRFETQNCTMLTEPTPEELGERIGAFKLTTDKTLTFEAAAAPATPMPAPAPAD